MVKRLNGAPSCFIDCTTDRYFDQVIKSITDIVGRTPSCCSVGELMVLSDSAAKMKSGGTIRFDPGSEAVVMVREAGLKRERRVRNCMNRMMIPY